MRLAWRIAGELLRDGEARHHVVKARSSGKSAMASTERHDGTPTHDGKPAERPVRPNRGAPLVATLARGGAAFALVLFLYFTVTRLVFARLHVDGHGPGAFLVNAMDAGLFVALVLVWLSLRAEESRLARELRTARSGSTELRALALRQRQKMPFLTRLCATRLGAAAVLLADGDVEAAHDELQANVLLARGGRLDWLRSVVEADEARASGTAEGLDRCLQMLRLLPPSGNREADRYRTHVLVKAILQRGDLELAQKVVPELEGSADEEERLYGVWLTVWFEGEGDQEIPYRGATEPDGGEISEGDLRMATLLARTQGADKLVERLEERLERGAGGGRAAIAEPAPRG
jgi:hypothetical protein